MIKRKIAALILIIFSILFVVSPVSSQQAEDFDFSKAYQDYQYNFDLYRNAHDQYVIKRSNYLNFQTLAAKKEAEEATLKMLQTRDGVARTYLTTLRMRLLEAQGVPENDREELFVRIDVEVDWFAEHKETLSSAGSLEDLVADSKSAESRYKSINSLFYEALSTISTGKVLSSHDRIEEQVNRLRNKFNDIKLEDRQDYMFSRTRIQTIERWFLEIENKITRAEEKQAEANKITVRSGRNINESSYLKAVKLLAESQQYLKEANSYVSEIIREMKIAE